MAVKYYIVVSPWEASSSEWELIGPFESLEVAGVARDTCDFTNEHYLVSAAEIAMMCRQNNSEDGEFTPPPVECDHF